MTTRQASRQAGEGGRWWFNCCTLCRLLLILLLVLCRQKNHIISIHPSSCCCCCCCWSGLLHISSTGPAVPSRASQTRRWTQHEPRTFSHLLLASTRLLLCLVNYYYSWESSGAGVLPTKERQINRNTCTAPSLISAAHQYIIMM